MMAATNSDLLCEFGNECYNIIAQNNQSYPDSKVHVAYMGPTWGRQVPGGPVLAHEPCYQGNLTATQ